MRGLLSPGDTGSGRGQLGSAAPPFSRGPTLTHTGQPRHFPGEVDLSGHDRFAINKSKDCSLTIHLGLLS